MQCFIGLECFIGIYCIKREMFAGDSHVGV